MDLKENLHLVENKVQSYSNFITACLGHIPPAGAYIIEVCFECDGAEDWQSMAQSVGLPEDLMVKRHLAWTNR